MYRMMKLPTFVLQHGSWYEWFCRAPIGEQHYRFYFVLPVFAVTAFQGVFSHVVIGSLPMFEFRATYRNNAKYSGSLSC